MNQQTLRDIMSGRQAGFAAAALRVGLSAAAAPYAATMRLRRWAYGIGLLPSSSAGVPVICVGNITTGGTGKTPMTAWVVQRLAEASARPAILTRGYKAVGGRSDEAELLKRLCDAPVIVNPDRLAGAKTAISGGADVLVMDDGFQHRRLRRDLDIVLIDATLPFGYGRCLPGGLLREPVSALKDADAIVITHSDAVPADQLGALRERLIGLAAGATIHAAVHKPVAIIDENGQTLPVDALAGRKICAFCGLGNPEHFFVVLRRLGARTAAGDALNDHVVYTPGIIGSLRRMAEQAEIELFVTTQKDHIKLDAGAFGRPVWQLAVTIDVVDGAAELLERIRTVSERPDGP